MGIPTGRDRGIAPALWQVFQEAWEPTCSERSDGVRPQRHAPQAVAHAQADIRQGDTGVVDIDLEQCCDRVHHDVWRSRVRRRVTWTKGCDGGGGAPAGSQGAGGETGSGASAAWAGRGPGTPGQSAHGPWRLRQRPARAMALPQRSFAARGRPRLRADCPAPESTAPPET